MNGWRRFWAWAWLTVLVAGVTPVGAADAETAGGPAGKATYRQYLDQLRRDRENEVVLATRRVAEVKMVWVAIARDDAFAARSGESDLELMNRRRDAAILRVYDLNSDGILAPEEKERYRADMALASRYAGKSRKPTERKRAEEAKKSTAESEATVPDNTRHRQAMAKMVNANSRLDPETRRKIVAELSQPPAVKASSPSTPHDSGK